MFIFSVLTDKSEINKVDFVLIGGHAFIAYGSDRNTNDIDILVCEKHLDIWLKIFREMRYEVINKSITFVRFHQKDFAAWPVDIMLVNEHTYNLIIENSRKTKFEKVEIKIPSEQDLISLKLHALKSGQEDRFYKDFNDIIFLMRKSSLDVKSDDFRQLCLKYATIDIYEKLKSFLLLGKI